MGINIKQLSPRDIAILWELASQNYEELTDVDGKTNCLRIEGMTRCMVWREKDNTPFIVLGNTRLYYEESYDGGK